MAVEWHKVDLTKQPFFFSGENNGTDSTNNYITDHGGENGNHVALFHEALQKELGGKDLEYNWSEEGYDPPKWEEEFGNDGWEKIFSMNAQNCCDFGHVTMARGPSFHGVRWVINFECLEPIWIREK